MFLFDKFKAKNKKRRISNKTLFSLCIIGGSIGGLFGMYLFRHKTQTWYYVYGIPIIFIIELIAIFYFKSI